jgi:Fur family zinc uptake transcriptional regulator
MATTTAEAHAHAGRGAADLGFRLDEAAELCEQQGVRFTDLRRGILALILGAPGPIGAYELLDQLRATRRGAAPPTVYRALDFLLSQGLIHKVERLNAFVGCPDAGRHLHPVQFLICRGCGRVEELEDGSIQQAVQAAASRHGFTPALTTIEVEGNCAACAGASANPVAA